MKNLKWIVLTIAVIIGTLSIWQNRNVKSYSEKIKEEREEKNNFMVTDAESPFSDAEKASFPGLNYFPIDSSLRIIADFKEYSQKETITVPTSDGQTRDYTKYGITTFKINGESCSLIILKSRATGEYFLPFADGTSGISSYGAGRYLDPEKLKRNSVILDFNKSYNPYCAYNERYQCPFPPKENILAVSITAGEKNFR